MEQRAAQKMTVDDFFAWSARQTKRFELIGGVAAQMMTESGRHSRLKTRLVRQLLRHVPEGSRCEVHVDGLAVRIDEQNVFEPDAMIDCSRVEDSATFVTAPTIVFEILSPSTSAFDMAQRVPAYLRVPSITHVVLIDAAKAQALLFSTTGEPAQSIHPADATLRLPLGEGEVTIALADIFSSA